MNRPLISPLARKPEISRAKRNVESAVIVSFATFVIVGALSWSLGCSAEKKTGGALTKATVDKMTDAELAKATVKAIEQMVEAGKSKGSCDARAEAVARVVNSNKPLFEKMDDIEKNDKARSAAMEKLAEPGANAFVALQGAIKDCAKNEAMAKALQPLGAR